LIPYIQVKRALLNWSSGIKDVPHGSPGFFSKTNWADHTERHQGEDVQIKRASALVKMVGKLKEIQWEKIIASATALAKQKKVVMIDVDALSSSDSSLVDGDEDLQVKVEEFTTLQEEDENGSDIYY
jgi:hypothetical protein